MPLLHIFSSIICSKIIFGISQYKAGKKYCRRCEVYFSQVGKFCRCCGMTLRTSPTNRKQKDRLKETSNSLT